MSNTFSQTINAPALISDVVVFGLAHGMLGELNLATAGAINKSAFWSTTLTGSTFGMSAGAYQEIMRQKETGKSYDIGAIIMRSLLQGAIDSVAAAPGGMQARAHTLSMRQPKEIAPEPTTRLTLRFPEAQPQPGAFSKHHEIMHNKLNKNYIN